MAARAQAWGRGGRGLREDLGVMVARGRDSSKKAQERAHVWTGWGVLSEAAGQCLFPGEEIVLGIARITIGVELEMSIMSQLHVNLQLSRQQQRGVRGHTVSLMQPQPPSSRADVSTGSDLRPPEPSPCGTPCKEERLQCHGHFLLSPRCPLTWRQAQQWGLPTHRDGSARPSCTQASWGVGPALCPEQMGWDTLGVSHPLPCPSGQGTALVPFYRGVAGVTEGSPLTRAKSWEGHWGTWSLSVTVFIPGPQR